jgi:VanZ family protein
VAALAFLLGALLLVPLPPALNTPVLRYTFDLGHVPLFAGVTLVLFSVVRGGRRRRALVAFIASALVAGGVEILQMAIPTREASLDDFGRGVAGALLTLAGIASWNRGRAWRLVFVTLSVSVAGAGVWLLVAQADIVRAFERQMPLLAGFEQSWELDRWHAKPATTMLRRRGNASEGDWSLEIDCQGGEYPGVSIEGFAPDWRRYRALVWSAYLPGSKPLQLTVRIDDDLGDIYGTRFVSIVELEPGSGTYRIGLDRVASALPHPMNLAQITELHFFLDHPDRAETFFIDAVRLEP